MNNKQSLFENLEYKSLEKMMKSTIHVDEFSSKMGEDADIVVISFYVRDKKAAQDLMRWFEKGYDFVLDADVSPGEIKPNRYLVYVELRRRNSVPSNVNMLLDDLSTLTEYEPSDWGMVYNNKTYEWNPETFAKVVPMTPNEYRERIEKDLNEVRIAAGLETKKIFEVDPLLRSLQSAAGL